MPQTITTGFRALVDAAERDVENLTVEDAATLYGRDDAFAYTGEVAYVRIEPGAQASDSYANRREREAQKN